MGIERQESVTCRFKEGDPAHTDHQYLEDIATAYWHSEALFAALRLEIFRALEQGASTLEEVARVSASSPKELYRLLRALERMTLICRDGERWFNAQISSIYLVPGKPSHMGDFLLYRREMQPNWSCLTDRVSLNGVNGEKRADIHGDESDRASTIAADSITATTIDYRERNFRYVRAMDTLVKHKGVEIASHLKNQKLHGPILDVGGGAGSMIRAIGPMVPEMEAVLFDLPEVIEASKEIYPDPLQWQGIETMTGDFRSHPFRKKFGIIIMSNFLHAYGPDEARELLFKAISLLGDSALMVIHDYFPDRRGRAPEKGALYDLTMMLNTYNGECHETDTVIRWLEERAIFHHEVVDLDTDSSIIVAGADSRCITTTIASISAQWVDRAVALGFNRAVSIPVDQIVVEPWVRKKCEYGCAAFGQKLHCPPYGMSHKETKEMVSCYETAILLEGAPPGKKFHEMLLALEREAFLNGYHKAFVFGAGPCQVCPSCPDERICRHPDLARPSMEGSGMDVYETARRGGISLTPVKERGQYVKYIGLLLLE